MRDRVAARGEAAAALWAGRFGRLLMAAIIGAFFGALAGLLEAALAAAAVRSPRTFAELFGYAVLIDATIFGVLGALGGLLLLGVGHILRARLDPAWLVAWVASAACLLVGVVTWLRWLPQSGSEYVALAPSWALPPGLVLWTAGGLALLVGAALAPWRGATARAVCFARRLAPAGLAVLVGASLLGVALDLSGRGLMGAAPVSPALPAARAVAQEPPPATSSPSSPQQPLRAPSTLQRDLGTTPTLTETVPAVTLPVQSEPPPATPIQTVRTRAPNVLLITTDSLRADRLGAYGHPEARTPTLDRLALEGVLFSRAYTNRNGTTPAHAGLFTGSYPSTHGIRSHMFDLLAPGVTTLAEVFSADGYATAGIFSWLAFEPAYSGLERGFQTYTDLTVNLPSYLSDSRTSTLAATYKRIKTLLALPATLDAHMAFSADIEEVMDGKADVTTDGALLWLEEYRDAAQESGRPFFLWIHYWDAHYPFTPPPPFDQIASDGCEDCLDGSIPTIRLIQSGAQLNEAQTRHLLRHYDGEIAFLDQEIGRLLARMDSLGLGQDTVIVVVGDHGESFGEQGRWLHGHDLLQSEIQVPLIMRFPNQQPLQKQVDAVVRSIDVMPTLLDYLGMAPPPTVEGRSLLRLIRGEEDGDGRYAVAELADRSIVTIVTRDWQLLKNMADGSARLYRVGPEGHGRDDLAAIQPEVAGELERELERWQAAHP